MQKIILSWSGGKDSVLALHKILQDQRYEVAGLLTTFAGHNRQVKFHFTDEELIAKQAEMLNLPLVPVYIGENADNNEYREAHLKELKRLQQQENISAIAFGDIFINSIRKFREDMLRDSGIEPVFPIWDKYPLDILQTFFKEGYRSIITTVNLQKLPADFAGKELTRQLVREFPEGVDVCGENGEYHTFVFNGPLFSRPIDIHLKGKSYSLSFMPEHKLELAVQFLSLSQNRGNQ